MPQATITLSDAPKFNPGWRPIVIISDKGKASEFRVAQRRGEMKPHELNALRAEAFDVKVDKDGFVVCRTQRGLLVNSFLRKDEWEDLDRAVVEAVTMELNLVNDLRAAGLTRQLGGLGSMIAQWNVASEKVEAIVSMSGKAQGQRDRVEKRLQSVPVPIIHSEYEVGLRELEASRLLGDALDTTEAMASGVVVGEKIEEIFFDGETGIEWGGNTIFGITTITGRDTDTASNYGGGDWGTQGKGPLTILGMLSALAAKNYRGPFGVYVANTQYWQVQAPIATRSGNDLDDILNIPGVNYVRRSDLLSDGVVMVVQLTRNVIEIASAMPATNREWSAPDEMAFYGKVMEATVPIIKTDYNGYVGIAHCTGA